MVWMNGWQPPVLAPHLSIKTVELQVVNDVEMAQLKWHTASG